MCFPEQGVAVALRPGDVIFFNPQYYHCVSGRCVEYEAEKVYLTSFYMKSMQLGLNDNSIAFVQNELSVEKEKSRSKKPQDNLMRLDNIESCPDLKNSFPANRPFVVNDEAYIDFDSIGALENENVNDSLNDSLLDVPQEIVVVTIVMTEPMLTAAECEYQFQLYHNRRNERAKYVSKLIDKYRTERALLLDTNKKCDFYDRFEKEHLLHWNQVFDRRSYHAYEKIQNDAEYRECERHEQLRSDFEKFHKDVFPIFYEGIPEPPEKLEEDSDSED
jgi:hypothetical protein